MSEPSNKKRKLEDGTEVDEPIEQVVAPVSAEGSEYAVVNGDNVSATYAAGESIAVTEDDKAKAKMILESLPQDKLSEILTNCVENIPGVLKYIEEASAGNASLMKLFVFNMSQTTTSGMLETFFTKYGTVVEAKVINGKNYGFVNFDSIDAAYNALKEVGSQVLDGETINCKLADAPRGNPAPASQASSYGGHGASASAPTSYTPAAPSASAYSVPSSSYGSANSGYGAGGGGGGQSRLPDTDDVKARKLFVRGISYETNRETIQHTYSQFGRVENIYIAMDRATGKTKGYCFVTMGSATEAQNVLANPTIQLEGRRITASLAAEGAPTSRTAAATTSYYGNSGAAAGGYGAAAGGGYGAAAGGYGAAAGGYGAAAGGYGAAAGGGYGAAAGGYGAPATGGYGAANGGYGAAAGYGAAPAAGYGAAAYGTAAPAAPAAGNYGGYYDANAYGAQK